LTDKPAVQAAVRQVADEYLRDPNVTSVGIGYKVRDGKRTDEIALQFTVGEKIAPEGLEAAATRPIPESITVNGMTFATDVVERDFHPQPIAVATEAKPDRKRRLDPMMPGASIGHVRSTAGTLGCLVREKAGGEIRILSNWHVLQGEDGQLGDPIAQPGPYDDNRVSENVCGALERSFLGLAGDCALASIDGRAATEEVLDLGVPVRQIGDPELGDRVVKSGRTTSVTHGIVTRVHTVTKLSYGSSGEHRIGSFEIGPDPDRPAENAEISMGGDSGSAWMAVGPGGEASEMMLGLHFAGETVEPAEYALACYASSVFEKLEIGPVGPALADVTVVVDPTGAGYDPRFLPADQAIEVPSANGSVEDDYAPTTAGDSVRHYTHFSLAMSAARRFCRWVAWNVDGSGLQKLSREDIDFTLDDAYEARYQVDDDLYAGNSLDRGHIARRADLLWGSPEEAERANRDSFFFTNITPQLEDFNQSSKRGLWGQLENAIFEDVKVDALRISVFGGPLFKDSDFPFRGVLVPRSFWKAIAYVEDGALKAKAYVLTQDDLEANLESLGLEDFNLYQVTLRELSALTGLGYGSLAAADTMAAAVEQLGAPTVRRIESRAQLI
jgi:endonuclease G, mitochondrial